MCAQLYDQTEPNATKGAGDGGVSGIQPNVGGVTGTMEKRGLALAPNTIQTQTPLTLPPPPVPPPLLSCPATKEASSSGVVGILGRQKGCAALAPHISKSHTRKPPNPLPHLQC
jgi:hypothetical protein